MADSGGTGSRHQQRRARHRMRPWRPAREQRTECGEPEGHSHATTLTAQANAGAGSQNRHWHAATAAGVRRCMLPLPCCHCRRSPQNRHWHGTLPLPLARRRRQWQRASDGSALARCHCRSSPARFAVLRPVSVLRRSGLTRDSAGDSESDSRPVLRLAAMTVIGVICLTDHHRCDQGES